MKTKLQHLGLIISLLLFPFIGIAYDFELNGLYYDINVKDKTVSVTYQTLNKETPNYVGELTIPASIQYANQELPVTSIGYKAFYNCKDLEKINLPQSLISIENMAFGECVFLNDIEFPSSLISIGNYAFSNCKNIRNFLIPSSVNSIGVGIFSGCDGITEMVFSEEINSIPANTFLNCRNLTSIQLHNNIASIGDAAFGGCSSLQSITIPESVTSIGYGAFHDCDVLVSINIPNSVTSLGDMVFNNCQSLKSVYLADSVLSLGYSAFAGCINLESIHLSSNLEKINKSTFSGCNSLSSLSIPSSVGTIYEYAFKGCTALSELIFEDGENILAIAASLEDTSLNSFYCGRNITNLVGNTYYSSIFSKVNRLITFSIGRYVESIQSITLENNKDLEIINTYNIKPPAISTPTNIQYANIMVNIPLGSLSNYQSSREWGNFWNLQETLPAPIEIEGIELNIEEVELNLEETFQLTATITPDVKGYNDIIWISSDEDIATVDDNGLVSTVSPGECVIIASSEFDPSVYAECKVNIKEPVIIEEITLNMDAVEIELDKTIQLTAAINPDIEGYNGLIWSSSNDSVALVNETGLVTAISEGECFILASSEYAPSVYAECKVTVIKDSGIENILEGLESFSIFSTQGVLIRKDMSKENLSELQKGIYLIVTTNGKTYKIVR